MQLQIHRAHPQWRTSSLTKPTPVTYFLLQGPASPRHHHQLEIKCKSSNIWACAGIPHWKHHPPPLQVWGLQVYVMMLGRCSPVDGFVYARQAFYQLNHLFSPVSCFPRFLAFKGEVFPYSFLYPQKKNFFPPHSYTKQGSSFARSLTLNINFSTITVITSCVYFLFSSLFPTCICRGWC